MEPLSDCVDILVTSQQCRGYDEVGDRILPALSDSPLMRCCLVFSIDADTF